MGALTRFEYICSVTNFAISDNGSPLMDVNVTMAEGLFITFKVDGKHNKEHIRYDSSLSRESLAAKPIRMMIEDF